MRKGLTLPNTEWRAWTQDEVRALWDLEPQTLVVLAYNPDTRPAVESHRAEVKRYVDGHPGTVVLYRPYEPDIASRDPRDWAKECRRRVEYFGVPGELIPANELNIEGMYDDWKRQAEWLQAFSDAWRLIGGGIPLHLPALSPTGNYRAGYAAYKLTWLFEAYDVVDVHGYGINGAGVVHELYELAGKPVCVSEFNQDEPGLFFTDVASVATDAVWFILSGTEDQAPYFLMSNLAYYDSFKGWKPMANGYVAPTDPDAIKRLQTYAIWALQRIHNGEDPLNKDDYAANVKAIGGDPSNLRAWGYPDESTVVDQFKSVVSQLKAIVGQV